MAAICHGSATRPVVDSLPLRTVSGKTCPVGVLLISEDQIVAASGSVAGLSPDGGGANPDCEAETVMVAFGRRDAYSFSTAQKSKDARVATRKKLGSTAWIRPDGGFSVRACTVIDLSDTGVKLSIDAPQTVSGQFSLLLSREGQGRKCRVKWRRGSQIGAMFV
jgi:hypothetical protein